MAAYPGSSAYRVYVGDLPKNASENELKTIFKEYGSVRDVWVARNPPGFAFVSFDSFEDADDAVKALNGFAICGARVRVEHSNDRDRARSHVLPPPPPEAPPSHHLLPLPPPPPPPPDGAPIRPFHPVFPYGAMDPFAGRSDIEFWRRHFPFGLPTMMPLLMNKPSSTKVYVGDLPKDASDKELQRIFSVYGPLRDVWVARNPPGFAFVEFVSHHDADEAVRKLNGAIICGERVRVEHSTDRSRSAQPREDPELPPRPPFDDRLLMDLRPPPIDFPPIRHPWPDVLPPREDDPQMIAKVFVGNLPKDACSREIENAFRSFGTIKDVWVARNPPGFAFVEFFHCRDADEAVRRMDGEMLCGGRIRVEHSYGPSSGRAETEKRRLMPRSFSPSRSRSRSRARPRGRAPRTPSPLSPPRSRSISRSSSRERRPVGKLRKQQSARIYVGGIPKFSTERDIEDAFRRFGSIKDVWVARNPPGFAFVDFAKFRDAEDAVRNSDLVQICGRRCRVEHSTKRVPRSGAASTSRAALRSPRSRSSLSESKSSKCFSGRSASKSSSR